MSEKTAKTYLSAAQKKHLREQLRQIPDDLRQAFHTAVDAWKNSWFSNGLAISSDPHARAVGKEFDALCPWATNPAVGHRGAR